MSSPAPDTELANHRETEDEPMQGSGREDEEGEGDVVMPGASDDDSSEEPEEDEEEERRIREGFIVDEDEEEEDEEDEERRKRRKRRKKHHRNRDEDTLDLEEDDLELLEENTGASFKKNRLTRLHRGGRDSESPPVASSSKRQVVESSDDDLEDNIPRVQDIQRIWDDDRGRDDDDDMDGMDDFIEYDDEEETGAPMDEETREERRKERRKREKERRRAQGIRPELAGIDANAWDEIYDVFGDGREYEWALAGDDEVDEYEEQIKPEMKYQDVFEPSEIRARLLTEDDDLIRAQDTPERMQLATSSLSETTTLSPHMLEGNQYDIEENDLHEAALWVTQRISPDKTTEFFSPGGKHQQYQAQLVMAVTYALRALFIDQYEVPYIWTHKRDYISHFDVMNVRNRFELLSQNELWRIYALGQKYRSLLQRQRAFAYSYQRLNVTDEYYEMEIRPKMDSVEVVADATEWLLMKYKDRRSGFDIRFHDDDETESVKKRKVPNRISAYEVAKKSIVSKLAQGFGIQPHQVVLNFIASHNAHFVDDEELNPVAYAEQFVDPDPAKAQPPEELLKKARMIFATEMGKDPLLRKAIREVFRAEAHVDVVPTERGLTKIADHHHYYNFKYLYHKKVKDMLGVAQFLHILEAESQLLVTVTINIPPDVKGDFERRLNDAFTSDAFSDTAKAWNSERALIVHEVLEQHLIPAATKWTREYLREEVEDKVTSYCCQVLRDRIDVAPFRTEEMKPGEMPSVLAVSWGKGDPHKDAITLVFLDEAGRMREHMKIDNLVDVDAKEEFIDLIKRRRPDVVVVGGFSMATLKLAQRVKEQLHGNEQPPLNGDAWANEPPPSTRNEQKFDIPVVYVYDEVARIYQHSKRAAEEFSALSPTAKYCVGLARYAQSPLNEYTALGRDITAITFNEDDQHLVPKEKLLMAFERTLVSVVNKVGVDVNRAVTDAYYQHLLPFVCGLGPRKAQVLVKKIAALGGHLVNRDQFIKGGILTTKIFLNAAGFLRISHDMDLKPPKNRHMDDDVPDPLDNTRIHPEDYELARKMATDALELDEEDVHDEHPSHVVALIMQDAEKDRKLLELNLDDFAVSLYETNNDQKRHTLNVIRDELRHPFAEQRSEFKLPSDDDVLTMLSGETPKTLRSGFLITVLVIRVTQSFAAVRTDSGIDGTIPARYASDYGTTDLIKKGQTIPVIVKTIQNDLANNHVSLELCALRGDVDQGDERARRVKPDDAWDEIREKKDKDLLQRKKRAEIDRTRRVIKHPNFHNFNSSQAEAYLDKQQRGDAVIRPSSKGVDHLAVTWKVDDKLYQHIDVVDLNYDPTSQTVGNQLVVDPNHSYADLDELIVNHVQAMARKVEELMAHERFKHGSEDELHLFLKNHLAANPAKSMYGFTLNRKKPGHFNLCFLANKNATVQTWPVRVTPEAYYLFDAPAVGVPELCDAFKVRHLHESQNVANAAGGKTPYGAGGRTPARPGHATPGHMSVRQAARTPNPYGGSATPYNGTTGQYGPPPSGYGPPQSTYGYQTPSHHPSYTPQPPMSSLPAGMNPERAAMIQNSGVWDSGGHGWS